METVKHLPVISNDSYHEVTIKVNKEVNNLIPALSIKFIIDTTNFRIEKGYVSILEREQPNLKEYKVDDSNFIYYNSNKKIASFLVTNVSFPEDIEPEELQQEMHNILGATKDNELIQSYRVFCLYWSVVDFGLDMSRNQIQGPNQSEESELTPPWEE